MVLDLGVVIRSVEWINKRADIEHVTPCVAIVQPLQLLSRNDGTTYQSVACCPVGCEAAAAGAHAFSAMAKGQAEVLA